MVNGIALANREKTVFCLGSDGSQQEGNDAEAARLAVAQNLNVKILIDDNDVTIAGHPSQYFKGYDLTKTLEGHGLKVVTVQGEDIDALWAGFVQVINHDGPAAIVAKRIMAPVSRSGTNTRVLLHGFSLRDFLTWRVPTTPMMSFPSSLL